MLSKPFQPGVDGRRLVTISPNTILTEFISDLGSETSWWKAFKQANGGEAYVETLLIMVLGEIVTNLLPSTPGWKGLESISLDALALQPLQLMQKTGLLTSRSCLRCWDVLTSLKLGWLATSLRVMFLAGGRLLNKLMEEKRMWKHC
nr:hypothetical protein [Tanacetum cinerariifolium]